MGTQSKHELKPVNAMQANDEQRMLHDAAIAFTERDTNLKRVRALRGVAPGFDRPLWQKMAELGWLGIVIPEEYGGQGLGFAELRVVTETLSRALVPEPLTACAVLARGAVLYGDNAALKAQLLPAIAKGDLILGVAWQEQLGGLNPTTIATTAVTQSSGSVVLNGTKRFVTPAAGADGFIVSALHGAALALYYVPANADGLSCTLERHADGTFAGLLQFKDVAVRAKHIVATAATAQAALVRAIDEATVMAGVELYGVMSRALQIALDYMNTRVQFGKQIGTYQALQHRAVDLYIQKALCVGALDDAIRVLDGKVDGNVDGQVSDAERSAAASRAKSRCADAAFAITRESIRFHGAMGIVDECDIGLYLQRALTLSAWLGNGAEHRRRYASVSPFEIEEISASPHRKESPPGTDWNAMNDADFRLEVRGFFEREYPENIRYLLRRARWSEIGGWVAKLANKGWIAPAWPRELGGMGLSPAKQIIFIEERERWGVCRAPDQGVVMIGPLLMRYGTEEQKRRFLPKIISGEHVWCQGYSEPNAGSDLASLTTEAVLDGDEWVINGRKIWTSLAHDSTHMFLLARTDRNAKRQAGISFFLLDLKTPGITIRPIPNIEGYAEFCEDVFDNVRIPKDNIVGEVNQGWTVAKTLLTFERLHNGGPRRALYTLTKIPAVAQQRGIWNDAEFQSKFTKLRLDVADLASAYQRYADIIGLGQSPDPGISMLKIWASETHTRLSELLIETAGDAGSIRDEKLAFGDSEFDLLQTFYAGLHAMIGAGSNDIQRNVLAKRVLGMPG